MGIIERIYVLISLASQEILGSVGIHIMNEIKKWDFPKCFTYMQERNGMLGSLRRNSALINWKIGQNTTESNVPTYKKEIHENKHLLMTSRFEY